MKQVYVVWRKDKNHQWGAVRSCDKKLPSVDRVEGYGHTPNEAIANLEDVQAAYAHALSDELTSDVA